MKRKLRANELEDEFSYDISKGKKNGRVDLEMKLGLWYIIKYKYSLIINISYGSTHSI